MSSFISFYKTMTSELNNRIGFEASQYKFLFENNNEIYNLNTDSIEGQENKDSHLYLQDPQNIWDAEKHSLTVKRTGLINNPGFLFGLSGIATQGSKLGIALSWMSKTSNQRGIVPICNFKSNLNRVEFNLKHVFRPGQLKGRVTLEIVLYLKESENASSANLARKEGTILGVLDTYTVVLEGNGSIFPILEVADPAQPLWWVSCDWTDPLTDSFSEENVSINLNTAHRYSKLINNSTGLGDSPILIEIICSSIQIIIEKAKESGVWDNIESGVGVEPGSIGEAIYYFIQTFNWDVSSPERLARSIREDLENRI